MKTFWTPRAAERSQFTDFKQEETRTRQVFSVERDLLYQIDEVKHDQTKDLKPHEGSDLQ